MGKSLKELNLKDYKEPNFASVKEVVFPFLKLKGVDPILGPEMKSTGEVMGIDVTFGKAFYKSQAAAGQSLPRQGAIFLSVKDDDKQDILVIAKRLAKLGFKLIATKGHIKLF